MNDETIQWLRTQDTIQRYHWRGAASSLLGWCGRSVPKYLVGVLYLFWREWFPRSMLAIQIYHGDLIGVASFNLWTCAGPFV